MYIYLFIICVHWDRFAAQTLRDKMARFPSIWDLHVFALCQILHSWHELCLGEGPQSREGIYHSEASPWFGTKHPNQSKSYVLVHPAATRENINSNISRPLATGLRWVSSVCETAPNRSGTHPWQEGWEALAVEPRLPRNAKPFQTGTVFYWIIRRGPSNDIQTYSNWF